MTVVTAHRLGEPCWVEYASTDVPRAAAFYGELFGWRAEAEGDALLLRRDGRLVAGLGPMTPGRPANTWLPSLLVEDAGAAERAALAAGAQSLSATTSLGDRGRQAIVADPGGAPVGLWEPGERRGFELVAEAGAPSWHELYALAYREQVDFYTRVFGWRTRVVGDTADFRYVTFGDEDDAAGGVYDTHGMLPEGVPSHWVVYFGVRDAAAASARAAELGGSVVRDPWDSEFGRFAQATDPLGGLFLLYEVGTGS